MKKLLALLLSVVLLAGLYTVAAATDSQREPLSVSVTQRNWKYDDAADSLLGMAWHAAMEEKLNRKLDITWNLIPHAEYSEKVALLINTNSITDVLLTCDEGVEQIKALGDMGMFANLAEYDTPNLDILFDGIGDSRVIYYTEDGALYLIPCFANNVYGQFSMNGAAIAEDLCVELGIDVSTCVTTDGLLEALKTYKAAYPDGVACMDGYAFLYSWTGFSHVFHTSYETHFSTDIMAYEFAPITENYRELLRYMNVLYVNELIPQDYAAWTGDMWWAALVTGKIFMLPGGVWYQPGENESWGGHEWTILGAGLHDPKIGTPWSHWAPSGERDAPYTANLWSMLVVNAAAKNVADIVEFVDTNYSEDIQTILTWGVEGETYEVLADGTKQFLEKYAYANVTGNTIEENAKIAAGFPDQNARSAGLWPYVQLGNFEVMNWPAFKIMQMDGSYVWENQKKYATETVSAENSNAVIQLLPQLSADAYDEYAGLMVAVMTYADECRAKFINGSMSIEDDWDSYLETIHKLGDIDAAVALYNDTIVGMEFSFD